MVRVFFWKHQRSGGFHERTGKELAVRMVGLLKNFQTFEKPRLNFIPRTGFLIFSKPSPGMGAHTQGLRNHGYL